MQTSISQIDNYISLFKIKYIKAECRIDINVGLDRILENACEIVGISALAVKNKSRKRELKTAQHLYCKIAKVEGYVLEKIGKNINKNHATVLHSIKTANNLYETDKKFKKMFDKLCMNLKNKK